MFEAALASLRPRRKGSIAVSTSLHAALAGALLLPPMLRIPELGVEPPENLPILDTRLLDTPKSEEPPKPREVPLPPRGTQNAGRGGAAAIPRKYVAPPPSGVIPDLSDVPATEDPCPDCEPTFTPPESPGDGGGAGTGGQPWGVEQPIVIGPDVTAPVPLATPAPPYPEPLRIAQIEGVVILEAVIDREGFVRDVRVLRGVNPLMDRTASETVLTWRYRAARVGSRPVAVYLTVTLNFRLRR